MASAPRTANRHLNAAESQKKGVNAVIATVLGEDINTRHTLARTANIAMFFFQFLLFSFATGKKIDEFPTKYYCVTRGCALVGIFKCNC